MVTHDQVEAAAKAMFNVVLDESTDLTDEVFVILSCVYVEATYKQRASYKRALNNIQKALKQSRREGASLTNTNELWPKVARLQYLMEKRREESGLSILVQGDYANGGSYLRQVYHCPKRAIKYVTCKNDSFRGDWKARITVGNIEYVLNLQGPNTIRQELARLYKEQPPECV